MESMQKEYLLWPWHRERSSFASKLLLESASRASDLEQGQLPPMFDKSCSMSNYLDISTQRAAIRASSSVVSIVTLFDDKVIFQGSGTIIENDGTILTSAKLGGDLTSEELYGENFKVRVCLYNRGPYKAELLAHDRGYNLAIAKMDSSSSSDVSLTKACLRPVDDRLSLQIHDDDNSPLLRPCSSNSSFNLIPGKFVIALGRYCVEPYVLMAARGKVSIHYCKQYVDFKEVLRADCLTTSVGEGGPLINHYGEVIGIMFCDSTYTAFLPINLVCKWLERYKKYGKHSELYQRPKLGMDLINFYAAKVYFIEKIHLSHPEIDEGVFVEQVYEDSTAYSAGIRNNDVIIQCCGKTVRSFLELLDIIWDRIGNDVEFVLIRVSHQAPLHLSVFIEPA